MNDDWQNRLDKKIFDYLEGYSACHDYYHAKRVKNYAQKIAKSIRCDNEVLLAATWLHDSGFKGHEDDVANHRVYGMKLAEEFLPEVDFPEEKIKNVLEVIRLHDNYSWSKNHEDTDIVEAKIIQDADRIDAIGAIGIARLAYFFGTQQLPIYSESSILEDEIGRPNHSMLDQLKREVEHKWKNMNFGVSKEISIKKQKIIEEYLSELKREIGEVDGN